MINKTKKSELKQRNTKRNIGKKTKNAKKILRTKIKKRKQRKIEKK